MQNKTATIPPAAHPADAEPLPFSTKGGRRLGIRDRLLRRLIAAHGRIVTDDALLYDLYAGGPVPATARSSLYTMVQRLRIDMPGRILRIRNQGYVMDPRIVPKFLRQDVDNAHVVLARSPQDLDAFAALRKAPPPPTRYR
jgi:hypothetical protein